MFYVVATITAHPGQRDRILEAFAPFRETVLAETGCLEYAAMTDATVLPPSYDSLGPDTFMVIGGWQSLAALQAHGASAHMAAYAAKTLEFTASRVIRVLSGV